MNLLLKMPGHHATEGNVFHAEGATWQKTLDSER